MEIPNCPKCDSEYTYQEQSMIICPMCSHEFTLMDLQEEETPVIEIKDAHGTVLSDGDDVIIIRDLRVRGASSPIKQGTRVRNIRLLDEPVDGHDIDCRIDGFGPMRLKSEVVKKG